MTVEYRAIRMTELDECLDLWDRAFAHTPREYFAPYIYNDPCFTPEYTRVCSVDGRLVSAVQICERRVRVGNVSLLMGGIGNVGTDPDVRGQGHSSRLLYDSIDAMRAAGIDFSVLYTGINPFYERLGWRGIPSRFYTGRLKESLDETQSERLRPCNWDEDI
ncbi:MAG: GNAT family N-acetyltransferase, partial [Armatimonadota bacterium]